SSVRAGERIRAWSVSVHRIESPRLPAPGARGANPVPCGLRAPNSGAAARARIGMRQDGCARAGAGELRRMSLPAAWRLRDVAFAADPPRPSSARAACLRPPKQYTDGRTASFVIGRALCRTTRRTAREPTAQAALRSSEEGDEGTGMSNPRVGPPASQSGPPENGARNPANGNSGKAPQPQISSRRMLLTFLILLAGNFLLVRLFVPSPDKPVKV